MVDFVETRTLAEQAEELGVNPNAFDPDSELTTETQATLFKFFKGKNLELFLIDLNKIAKEEMIFEESDFYRQNVETSIWELISSNLENTISYANYCLHETNFFAIYSSNRSLQEL